MIRGVAQLGSARRSGPRDLGLALTSCVLMLIIKGLK